MGRVEKTVFISYRRTNFPWALAIFQDLTQHGYDVFFDFTGLGGGDFESVILENIRARAHFLVLLTPSALDRCAEPGDWLRREIEAAVDDKRNIVPLMLEGFDFGTLSIATQLTGKLAVLKKYNALSIPPAFFFDAMDRLRNNYMNVALDTIPHPASVGAQQGAAKQKTAAQRAPMVAEETLTAQQWYERGFDAADLNEKVRLYTETIRIQPDFASAFINRGNARRAKGDIEGALQDYSDAIRIQPDADAFMNRGLMCHDQGDLNGALLDFNKAIYLNPEDSDAFYNRGNTRRDLGDLGGALSDYTSAIRLNSNFAEAFNNRAALRFSSHDFDGASQDLEQAIRLRPNHAGAYANRGSVRLAKGDPKGALIDLNEAIRLEPNFAIAFSNRGAARFESGDVQGALEDYDEAIRLDPNSADAISNRDIARKTIANRSKT